MLRQCYFPHFINTMMETIRFGKIINKTKIDCRFCNEPSHLKLRERKMLCKANFF